MPDPRPISDLNRALDLLAGCIMEREPEILLRVKLALAFDALRREILAEVKADREGKMK
jgi:hypothetical protein